MTRALLAAAVSLLLASGARAQEAPKPDPPTLPGLDELLGLEESTVRDGADPLRWDLDRRLSGREAGEQFRQAVDLMGQTAERLGVVRDTGVTTQRLQEDVIRKLDMLIRQAEQNRRPSPSRSRPQQQDQQNQPDQQQARQSQASQGENTQETDPPAGRDPELSRDLAARGAAWGALPERVRDSLMQGSADRFSSIYQRATEAYYRKLAEEGPR